MMQKPKFSPLIMVVVLMVAVTGPLFGHVSFNPSTAQAGVQHMLFYIRAPVEKDIPMVELGLEMDQEWRNNGGDVNSFQDIPGLDTHVEWDDEGKVERVWWTGDGATRPTHRMVYMSLDIPEKPGVYPFKSWQKYTDGSVVWWNEPRGESGERVANPYPIVTVKQAPILTAEAIHVGSRADALLALAISLLSFRSHLKNES